MTTTMASSAILIRPLQPQDASQAAKIWVDGLQQTADCIEDPKKKQEISKHFTESAAKECLEGGCVGPKGEGLVEFWCKENQEADCRRMYVAVRDATVLGLVGVKRGMDYIKFPNNNDEDYSSFSIWKMSVAERRTGVGRKLMQAAEGWVRQQTDAKLIRLFTGNPIAASFYLSVGFVVAEKKEHYGVYEKVL